MTRIPTSSAFAHTNEFGRIGMRGVPLKGQSVSAAALGLRVEGVKSVESRWTCTVTGDRPERPQLTAGRPDTSGRPSKPNWGEGVKRARQVHDAYELVEWVITQGGRSFVVGLAIDALFDATPAGEGSDKVRHPPGIFYGPWPVGESELDYIDRLIQLTASGNALDLRVNEPTEDRGSIEDAVPVDGDSQDAIALP